MPTTDLRAALRAAAHWRARALAAETELAGANRAIDIMHADTCGDADADTLRERAAAAQWAKVAPLIERLRWPKSPHDEERLVAELLAATEATP